MRRISFRVLIGAALVLGVVGITQSTRAQDEAEPGDKPEAPPGGAAVLNDIRVEIQMQEPFGPQGEEGAREGFKSGLLRKIERIDKVYRLTPEQKKKLQLAGQGDIKRSLDRHREQRNDPGQAGQIVMIRRQPNVLPPGLQPLGNGGPLGGPVLYVPPLGPQRRARPVEVMRLEVARPVIVIDRIAQPAAAILNTSQDLFGDGSLFAKTLTTILTPEQRARAADTERLATYRTRVNWVLFPLSRELGLSREQHRRLLDVIAKETRPLQKYGELDEDAILLQASRLPDAQLKPICDDAQWRRLQARFDRSRRMEDLLVEKGYLARAGH
jgi:hypothetical protein